MIKMDIINEVSKAADITKVKAEVAVEAVLDAMKESMMRGERIELRGFGVFQVKPRKRGIGRNPRTGKEVRIPPGRTIRFKPGQGAAEPGRRGEFQLSFPRPADYPLFPGDEAFVPEAPVRRHGPWRAALPNVLLFALTIASVDLVGGPRLVAAMLGILLAHEMGHYLACRYYGIDASLPYFIPFPFHLVGTLGAFIRVRSPFPDRRALFDVGIAGPLAGFAVCVPVLFLGLHEARWEVAGPEAGFIGLGEPALFRWLAAALLGPGPTGATLVIGPLGLAAWFGLFVTAVNLFPVGQLDGGHVLYALIGRRAQVVSRIGMVLAGGLALHRPVWLVWAVLLFALGRRGHPPTLADLRPVGRGRVIVGVLGAVVFALCFTPDPILVDWSEYVDAFASLFR